MSDFNFDIATVIAAVVAAIAALFSAYAAKKDNAKKDMLENLTTERINDVHNIRKWSGILLSEASIALNTKVENKDERISRVLSAANELWFVFKPVYTIDLEVLYALKHLVNALLSYYRQDYTCDEESQKRLVANCAGEFRRKAFLYAQSDWTCVKNQILEGQRSSYDDFNQVHAKNQRTLEALDKKGAFADQNDNIWVL